ncbi:hypothetical protein IRJ41_019303, partial [Triplophysa rosa]
AESPSSESALTFAYLHFLAIIEKLLRQYEEVTHGNIHNISTPVAHFCKPMSRINSFCASVYTIHDSTTQR